MAAPKRPKVIDGDGIPIRPFNASLPMALLQSREGAMRRFRPMLAEYDLTEQQWRVLRALAAADAALPVGEVADRTFLLGPSLSRILSNLEDRDLIERTTSPADQRSSNLALAAKGLALVKEIAPHSEATYKEIEAAFGSDRLRSLLDELHDLTEALTPAQQAEESA